MKEIIDGRAAVISLIFSLFGSAVTKLFVINISELGWDVTGFAMVVALIVSLLISVFFIKRNAKKIVIRRNVLIVLFLASGVFYFTSLYQLVCNMTAPTVNDKTRKLSIVHGSELQPDAAAFRKLVKTEPFDECSLLDSFATRDPEIVWTRSSIKSASYRLTFSYILFVAVLVGLLTHLSEELLKRVKKT